MSPANTFGVHPFSFVSHICKLSPTAVSPRCLARSHHRHAPHINTCRVTIELPCLSFFVIACTIQCVPLIVFVYDTYHSLITGEYFTLGAYEEISNAWVMMESFLCDTQAPLMIRVAFCKISKIPEKSRCLKTCTSGISVATLLYEN